MEGGYINEGGQLKTKNGQKYIVNDTRDEGIFVSKLCAILTIIFAIAAVIVAVLITYFWMSLSKDSCSNYNNQINGPVASAGIFNNDGKSSLLGSTSIDESEVAQQLSRDHEDVNNKIELYEGWNPQMYRLIIEPNLKTSTNNGTVYVELTRDQDIKGIQPIVFDIHNITIQNTEVKYLFGGQSTDLNYRSSYGPRNESYHIRILSDIEESEDFKLKVRMDFTSQITETMQGVYKSPYKDVSNGNTIMMVSTQFSPIDARRAFPCFDRPDKKANFSVSIVHEQDITMALSNMPSYFTSFHRPGYIQEDFETTPKMSTYLLAFIVSNLVKGNYSETHHRRPSVEIWSRPEVIDMTKYANSVTRKILPFFEEYFGIPFKLPKLDLVSVPDFGYNGMENWGLITFRDSSLLVPEGEEQSSSAEHKAYVTNIIAHELAHQWFGNLVTPKWWNDLWLKEGFATYLSYLAVNQIEPEWDVLLKFAVDEFSVAMAVDSDKYAHAIASPVTTTSEVRRIFDPIAYSKGAIILRMVNWFIGDKAFKMSIQEYLKKFAYKNAVHDELWDLMTHYGHQYNTFSKDLKVNEIMDSWTLQAGYPIVSVVRSGKDIIISQERYTLPKRDSLDNSSWYIPINYVTDEMNGNSQLPIYWMPNNKENITIPNVFLNEDNSENLIYLNHNRQGYYRVNYDYSSWVILNKRFGELPNITRGQLLEDSFYLAKAELLTYDIPLTFLSGLRGLIDDHLLWTAAAHELNFLTYKLNREPAYETFRAFMRFVVRPAFDLYGMNEPDKETHTMLAHRATVVEYACKFNYDRCTNSAQLKYREWMREPKRNLIKPNFKGTIYCTALREGSFQEWYFAYNRYKETTVASEKEQIINALGCTTKPWLLSKYLNMTIDKESGIRKQDGSRAFAAVAQNNIGYEIAYDFLVTNIKQISDYYGDGFSTLSEMVHSITTYMDKSYHLEQLDRLTKKVRSLGLTSFDDTIKIAKEDVKNSIYWRSRSYYSLKGFLESMVNEFHINLY